MPKHLAYSMWSQWQAYIFKPQSWWYASNCITCDWLKMQLTKWAS